MLLEIIEIYPFKALLNRYAVCSLSIINLEGKVRQVYSCIAETDLSILLTQKTQEQIQEMAIERILNDLNPKWEFGNVFYFTFTGSHFQQDSEKPAWVK